MAVPATTTRTAHPIATSGSQTITQAEPSVPFAPPAGTLRLRAESAEERHIQWAEDVVDNEGMGKKSSKVCCIYHKPREVGESSDESSSDSSSSSDGDSDVDNGEARPMGRAVRGRRQHRHHDHTHDHGDVECGPGGGDEGEGKGKGKARRKRSPNAYEKMPNNTGGKAGGSK